MELSIISMCFSIHFLYHLLHMIDGFTDAPKHASTSWLISSVHLFDCSTFNFQGLISCKELYVTFKELKREGKISREEERIVVVSPAD